MFNLSKPHGDKLFSLLVNNKLPESDKPNVEHAIERYEDLDCQIDRCGRNI